MDLNSLTGNQVPVLDSAMVDKTYEGSVLMLVTAVGCPGSFSTQ